MNYAALSTMIQQFCASTEAQFVANIPAFVQLAEEHIYNSVQIPAIRQNKVGQMTADNKYLTLPDDWLSTFSLAVIVPETGAYEFLINKDVNFIREAYPVPTDTGVPKYYAQFDKDSIIVAPTPDDGYIVELHYYYYPQSIVTAGTSWLGDNFENVLLYGALKHAYLFQKGEPDLIQQYETKYTEALALLKQHGDGKQRRDSYRSGQVTVPVL
jgi:hypothetical protein